jgi:hypothetical protein
MMKNRGSFVVSNDGLEVAKIALFCALFFLVRCKSVTGRPFPSAAF